MGGFLKQYWLYLVVALALHAALVAFLVVNLDRSVMVLPDEQPEAIEATVVDEQLVEQQLQRLRDQEARRLQEIEEGRLAAQRAAEQRAAEERRIQELQAQREREARDAQQARERQQREAAERQRQEQQRAAEARRQREAEEARLAEVQRQREAEAERQRQAEAERQRRAEAEAEERRQAARRQELLVQYRNAIQAAVERAWIRPEAWPPGTQCTVRVSQIPGGEVVQVNVTQSCGSPVLDRSVQDAVLRASPLPRPPDPAVFSRELEFVFRPGS